MVIIMFKRLHLQLTGLCALITIAILSVFTILYLSMTEYATREESTRAFQNNFDTLKGSLEPQSVLTFQYLLRMEQNNDCFIFLWDNGTPLSFNHLESHSAYQSLANAVYDEYSTKAALEGLAQDYIFSTSQEYSDNGNVRIGISYITANGTTASEKASALRKNRGLVLLIISPNTALHSLIIRQRITISLLSFVGCLLLIIFSYLFTGRMIKPIRENHEKQLSFIAGASHELRTPLAVILSAVSAHPPHFEETIRAESLRMGRLVDEMLLLSRLDRDSPFQFKPMEADTFLLNLYEQIEHYVLAQGRRLTLSLPDEPLPKVYADADKLRQLLECLIQNAISYTDENGQIELSLHYEKRLRQLCLQVADNGIGISDEEKDRIFERFYRVDSAHHSKEHFGLGLCIAKEIVEAHKGQITVTDTAGGGCTFRCVLPINPVVH
ncbi:MAG: ATP-binding protein [Muribaculum sp.]|nr:ATP-binding protein [Muribaculum sp.]